jgi:hypothetical protein
VYFYLLNNGSPNYTAIHAVSHFDVYAGFDLSKNAEMRRIVYGDVHQDAKTKTITLGKSALTLLHMSNVRYIITDQKLISDSTTLQKTVTPPDPSLPTFFLYQLDTTYPLYYGTNSVIVSQTYADFRSALEKKELSGNATFIHTMIPTTTALPSSDETMTIVDAAFSHTKISATTESDTDGYFVISMQKYPGWTATVDGKPTPIYAANLMSMAIPIPKGTHTVHVEHTPQSLLVGGSITVLSLLLYLCGVLFLLFRNRLTAFG